MEDNELRAYFARIDERFAQMDKKFETRFAQMDTKFDDLRTEVGVRMENMHSDIKKIAEGVSNVDAKLDRFRTETLDNLVDIRTDLRVSFTMLGKRVTDLENSRS